MLPRDSLRVEGSAFKGGHGPWMCGWGWDTEKGEFQTISVDCDVEVHNAKLLWECHIVLEKVLMD
jgi:MinD superfamily P-loop ATPase